MEPISMALGIAGLISSIYQGFNAGKQQDKSIDFQKEQNEKSLKLQEDQMKMQEEQTRRSQNLNALEMLSARRDIMKNKSINNAMYSSLFPQQSNVPNFKELNRG